jgi:hypothetical protein
MNTQDTRTEKEKFVDEGVEEFNRRMMRLNSPAGQEAMRGMHRMSARAALLVGRDPEDLTIGEAVKILEDHGEDTPEAREYFRVSKTPCIILGALV